MMFAQLLLAMTVLTGPPLEPTLDLSIVIDGYEESAVLQAEMERTTWPLAGLRGEILAFYNVVYLDSADVTGIRGPFLVAIINRAERKHIAAHGSGMALMALHEFCVEYQREWQAETNREEKSSDRSDRVHKKWGALRGPVHAEDIWWE